MGFRNSVQETMSRGFRKIPVEKIRINENNFYAKTEYEDEAIDQMANLIQENGQDANVLVYLDPREDDGKEYTLLSGERRFKAVARLAQIGKSDGMIQAKIEEAPESASDEMLRLIRGNAQRNKTQEIRVAEVKALQNIWEEMKREGRAQGKFVDWAGQNIGVSARQITNYLKIANTNVKKERTEDPVHQGESEESNAIEDAELISFIKDLNRDLKAQSSNMISINKKMTISIRCGSLQEVMGALDQLGFTDQVEEIKNYLSVNDEKGNE